MTQLMVVRLFSRNNCMACGSSQKRLSYNRNRYGRLNTAIQARMWKRMPLQRFLRIDVDVLSMNEGLFIPQCFYRIEPRGITGGVITKEHTGKSTDQER